MRPRCLLLLLASSLIARPAQSAPATATPTPTPESKPRPMIVEARLARLPQAERCRDRRLIWVVASYRIEKVVRGDALKVGAPLAVAHACPGHARGFSRWGRGNAGRLRAGDRHRLHLLPFSPSKRATIVDPNEPAETRYRALRTDALTAHPRVLVTVRGPGRQHRFPFARERVTIGASSGADIRLAAPSAPLHAELVVEGDKLRVRPLGEKHFVLIDGKAISARGRTITYLSRIEIGPYRISASLLPATPLRR